jgi:hypothetical protein
VRKNFIVVTFFFAFVFSTKIAPAEESKVLGPRWFSLDSTVGVVDKEIQEGKANLEKYLFGIKLSGYLDTSYTWASTRPRDPNNISIRSFDLDHNEITFNAFNLTVERPEPEKGWGVGFRLSGLFGRTGELLREATLWGPNLNKEPSAELFESYISTTLPIGKGLGFQGGLWVTTLGTEVIPAPGDYNYNISRSFLFGFSIPFRHLGSMFSYPLTDTVSLNAGIVTGWDDPYDNNNRPSGMGGIKLEPSDKFNLNTQFIVGPEQDGNKNTGRQRWTVANVANYTPIDSLALTYEFTIGGEEKATADGGDALWYGMAGYISNDWTDRFNTAFRGEWFRDEDGARTGGGASAKESGVWLGEITLTTTYKFTSQLLGRWEVRQDWASRDVFQSGRSGVDDNQTQVSIQAIYTF